MLVALPGGDSAGLAALSHGVLARVSTSAVSKADCALFNGLCANAEGQLVAYSTATGAVRFMDANAPEERVPGLKALAWVGADKVTVTLTDHVEVRRAGELVHSRKCKHEPVVSPCSDGRVCVILDSLVLVLAPSVEPSATRQFSHDEVQTSATARSGLVVCGSKQGRITIHRDGDVASILHWHSSAVLSLCVMDDGHLLSGGHEGVLVLWRIDESSQSRTFLPRLGASLCAIAAVSPTSAGVLLSDGALLHVQVPSLNIQSHTRASLPMSPSTVVVSSRGPAPRLAVALDNHRPGCLTVIDPAGVDPERVVDVTGRNPVSSADAADRWRVQKAAFSPNGAVLGVVLVAGGERRELRVLVKEVHALRVPLHGGGGGDDDGALACCDDGVAVGDRRSLRVFKPGWVLELEVPGTWAHAALGPSCVATAQGESCRIWSRATGQQLACVAMPGGCSGLAMTPRGVFAWGGERAVQLPTGRVLLLPGLRAGCSTAEGMGALCGDAVVRWDGHVSKSERVGEAWVSVETNGCGGWLLRDADGRLRVALSASRAATQSVAAVSVRPLRDVVGGAVPVSAAPSTAMAAASVSEWCGGVPSHLLGRVPMLAWPAPAKKRVRNADDDGASSSRPAKPKPAQPPPPASSVVGAEDVDEAALVKLWA